MSTEPRQPPTGFLVGDLEIDVGLQRVVRDGVELPLPKLSFDLLLALVRSAPNFVSFKELLARVWPGLVVADKTVSQRVKLLRDALGDAAETPRYIAGLRGRGYRIVAPVRPVFATQEPGPRAGTSLAQGARGRARWLIVASTAAVAAVAWSLWSLSPTAPSPEPAGANPETPMVVAVMPFRNPGGGEADTFISQGIAEAVIDRLAAAPGLLTISEDSAFQLAASNLTPEQIAARLGARYVLDGALTRSGDGLQISVELWDTATAEQLWSAVFERPIEQIFELQDSLAEAAIAALSTPTDAPATSPHRRPTGSIDAYLEYLRGRALLGRWTVSDAEAAAAAFAAAIERDPDFAEAYASLYDARMLAADRAGGGASPNAAASFAESPLAPVRARNQALIDLALELDPDCGPAYFARAIWAAADSPAREQDFQRGMALDPSNGRGITEFAEFLDRANRPDEAERLLDRAIAVDPISPRAHFRRVMRRFPGDPAELEAGMARVLEIDPNYQPALQRSAKYRWMLHGDFVQAIPRIERALALDPGNPWITHTAIAMYLDLGQVALAREALSAVENPEVAGDLLLDVYGGNIASAGAAAFEDTAFANGRQEAWGVFEAIRDRALQTGDIEGALDYLQRRTNLLEANTGIDIDNFRMVPIVAQLLIAAGRNDEARDMLTEAIHWIDDYHVPNLGTIYALRTKASSLALLGETSLALDALDASFRGDDYLQWWYTLEHDPIWAPLRGDPRFVEIAARVHEYIRAQNAALEALPR